MVTIKKTAGETAKVQGAEVSEMSLEELKEWIGTSLSNLTIEEVDKEGSEYLVRLEWESEWLREQARQHTEIVDEIFESMGYKCHTFAVNDDKKEAGIFAIDYWCTWYGSMLEVFDLHIILTESVMEFLSSLEEGDTDIQYWRDLITTDIDELKFKIGEIVGAHKSEDVKAKFEKVYERLTYCMEEGFRDDIDRQDEERIAKLLTSNDTYRLLFDLCKAIIYEDTHYTKEELDALKMQLELRKTEYQS